MTSSGVNTINGVAVLSPTKLVAEPDQLVRIVKYDDYDCRHAHTEGWTTVALYGARISEDSTSNDIVLVALTRARTDIIATMQDEARKLRSKHDEEIAELKRRIKRLEELATISEEKLDNANTALKSAGLTAVD